MRGVTPTRTLVLWFMLGLAAPALSQEAAIGRTVESLLEFARDRNPEYAAMQAEADAAAERVTPAGALPDPKFRMELRDITKFGDQNPTLSPSRVGSTRYLLSQDIPWFGKRDLKREVAELEGESAKGAPWAPGRTSRPGSRRATRSGITSIGTSA
jgi:cobalt-zinc-cadmium efflux system outer membrane protein